MRRMMATMTVLLTLGLSTACSGNDEVPSTGSDQTKIINITFSAGTVTPNGERVEVKAGQTIELVVKADEAGEIHVHSTPEQELKYVAGTTSLKLTLDKPGVVDVESHTLELTIVQLEVR